MPAQANNPIPPTAASDRLLALFMSKAEIDELRGAIANLIDNSTRIDIWVNGDENAAYVSTGGKEVPSIRRLIAERRMS